jgi:hypothetical protein
MRSSSPHVLSIKRKALVAVATLTIVGGSAAAPGSATAATPECGGDCISVFSSELGTYAQPNFVEAVLDGGGANVGQPVGLKAANRLDPSQDIVPVLGMVADFYKKGLVSAEANRHYGNLLATQQTYAPFGIETELCVGLASVKQHEGLTLQPCSTPTTVWIPHFGLATAAMYFPIINAATTDFSRPFAMHLPRNEVASGRPLQMQARRLQFRTGDKTLPPRQLWGVHMGVLD